MSQIQTPSGTHFSLARAILAFLATFALTFGIPIAGHAFPPQSSATISVGSVSAAAGSNVNLTISLAPGTAGVSTLQFDLQIPAALTYSATATGDAATNAGKSASGSAISSGVRVLIFGLNQNTIGAGPVAVVTLAIAAGASAGSLPIPISALTASSPAGVAVPVIGVNGQVTVLPPADMTPPVISGVTASGVSATGATIAWTTNEASDSQVEYGTTTSYGSTTTLNNSLVTSHSQALTGLTGNTTYHYRVKSRDTAGNLATSGDFTFKTSDITVPAISAVAASSITTSGATITWTTNEASDSQVDYGTTATYGSSTTLNTSRVTSHSQALTGLTASTVYHYHVKSRDAAGNLGTSGDYTFTTSAPSDTVPPVLSAVAASSITTTGATITWTTNEASDSQVEYGTTTSYGSSTTLNASRVTSHSQALTGLTSSTIYHYRVKSRDAAGNLATSADSTFTTAALQDVTPPVISGVFSSSVTSTGATISWTTNENSDSQVDYGTTLTYGSTPGLNPTMAVSHTQALSGLSASTTYHYRVKSRDAAGNQSISGDFTFTTSAPPDTAPPVISGVAAANVTTTGATISWTTDEVSTSQLDYGTTIAYGSSTPLNGVLVTAHSQALTGLAAGTAYHYRVKSSDEKGNTAVSADFTFTTAPSDQTPPVISNVGSSGVSATGATISWTTDEASSTQVDYGTAPSSYTGSSARKSTLVTAHTQTLSGLVANTTYHYRAKSADAAGNLGTSSDYTFTTQQAPSGTTPTLSTPVVSRLSSQGATISWTTDLRSDSQVLYGTTSDLGRLSRLNTKLVTAHSQNLGGLLSNTTYYYRVQSRTTAGGSALSEVYTFQTAPPKNAKLSFSRLTTAPGTAPAQEPSAYMGNRRYPTVESAYLDNSRYTGIAIANLGGNEAVLTFTAYDETGAQLAGPGITNPVQRTVPPAAQIAVMDSDLFGDEVVDRQALGWISVDSSSDAVNGFTVVFNLSLTMMDGAPITAAPLTQFVFPEIEDQGFTDIHIANPDSSPAHITFQLVSSYGTIVASAFRTINPMGAMAESLETLFPFSPPESSNYIRVVSDIGVTPFELLGKAAQDVAGLNGLDVDTGSTMLYSPQYAVGGPYRTTLSITNLDGIDGSLMLRLVGDDGAQIGPTRIMPIAANGKVYITDQSFFAVPQDQGIEGYVEVYSDGPRVVGNVVFGDPARSSYVTSLPLVSSLETAQVFSHVASDDIYFMGLSLLNPNPVDAVAAIDLYKPDGSLDLSTTVTIPARQRICQLLYQFFPELAGQSRTFGYIRVTTDEGIAAFSAFGTWDLRSLSAIPAQIIR